MAAGSGLGLIAGRQVAMLQGHHVASLKRMRGEYAVNAHERMARGRDEGPESGRKLGRGFMTRWLWWPRGFLAIHDAAIREHADGHPGVNVEAPGRERATRCKGAGLIADSASSRPRRLSQRSTLTSTAWPIASTHGTASDVGREVSRHPPIKRSRLRSALSHPCAVACSAVPTLAQSEPRAKHESSWMLVFGTWPIAGGRRPGVG